MKTAKKIFVKQILCFLLFASAVCTGPVRALAAGEPYSYTVRVFPGNQGEGYYENAELPGDAAVRIEITVLNGRELQVNGETVITLANDRYYIRGVRIAGQDTVMSAPSFTVTQDQDYVAAYGMRAGAVRYTINYVDAEGRPMPGTPGSNCGYGSAGDPVIVGAYPVDGYLPYAYSADGTLVQTYNLTNSSGLSADESQNVFTFIYQEAPAASGGTGARTAGGAGAAAGGNIPAGGAAAGGSPAEAAAVSESGGAASGEEILDIDAPLPDGGDAGEMPAEGAEAENAENGPARVKLAPVGIGAGVIAAVLVLLIAMAARRKRTNGGQNDGSV